jgi:hypothetical protein
MNNNLSGPKIPDLWRPVQAPPSARNESLCYEARIYRSGGSMLTAATQT